jgi:hypothetical protein
VEGGRLEWGAGFRQLVVPRGCTYKGWIVKRMNW